jgi:hypothetical protein
MGEYQRNNEQEKVMKKLFIILAFGLTFACERVEATQEECVSSQTLAQAVLDKDLQWNQILVCK